MVHRWDIITIGNLSRNRYWGEGEDVARRPPLCTSTLVQADGFRLLADPPIADPARMAAELDRRTGLKLADVDIIFITHAHGDHHPGLACFPSAQWLAAPGVAESLNQAAQYSHRIDPVSGTIRDQIEVLPTPGHTPDHHSLRFECDGVRIVIAGDAVMTRDFWRDRRGFFNSADPQTAALTIDRLATLADVVIPGHDNCFLTR